MKIVHLNAFDRRGGAAISAQRIHQGLLDAGTDSALLVQFKSGAGPRVCAPAGKVAKALALLGDTLDPLLTGRYRQRRDAMFSANWMPSSALRRIHAMAPEIVHLHWINAGMLPIRDLRSLRLPVVWTLHDMWPFTGGCHQSDSCDGYLDDCAACAVLEARGTRIQSARIHAAKRRVYRDMQLVTVAPSEWLAERARRSSLFRDIPIRVIRHGVDRSVYAPWDRAMARRLLGLPEDRRLVMFCSAHGLDAKQKGGQVVRQLARRLTAELPDAQLVLMGPESDVGSLPPATHALGLLTDDVSRALAYAAVDLLIQPSTGESFGNVILESLSCGTPVVSYATGIAPELLADERGGASIDIGEEEALIAAVIGRLDATAPDRQAVRSLTVGHDIADMTAAYTDLYRRLVAVAGAAL